MSRKKTSVVMATYNRCHLLMRSLFCYASQNFDNDSLEIVVIDDSSEDKTESLCKSFASSTGIQLVYLKPYPKGTGWRDCGAVLNYGIRASSGDEIVLTHPEVMPGKNSLQNCVDAIRAVEANKDPVSKRSIGAVYACCKIYYLSPRDQERIDSVPWHSEGVLALRQIAGFYEPSAEGNPDYTHEVTDNIGKPGFRIKTWESWVFGGCSRRVWTGLGGMLETSKWGSVDIAFVHRRNRLGIQNYTCPGDLSICAHQNHDMPGDTKTNRSQEDWVEELKNLSGNPSDLCYPKVDNLGWGT